MICNATNQKRRMWNRFWFPIKNDQMSFSLYMYYHFCLCNLTKLYWKQWQILIFIFEYICEKPKRMMMMLMIMVILIMMTLMVIVVAALVIAAIVVYAALDNGNSYDGKISVHQSFLRMTFYSKIILFKIQYLVLPLSKPSTCSQYFLPRNVSIVSFRPSFILRIFEDSQMYWRPVILSSGGRRPFKTSKNWSSNSIILFNSGSLYLYLMKIKI